MPKWKQTSKNNSIGLPDAVTDNFNVEIYNHYCHSRTVNRYMSVYAREKNNHKNIIHFRIFDRNKKLWLELVNNKGKVDTTIELGNIANKKLSKVLFGK